MSYKLIEQHRCFQGSQSVYSHQSQTLQCEMRFGLYLPNSSKEKKVPVLFFLSGLTCSEQNFITKAGAQRVASELNIAIVVPDTSPRGCNLEDNREFLGEGASFYVNATQEPWKKHYQMYSYLCEELPNFINSNFEIDIQRCGIFGHSMGGHGALLIGLRNPNIFRSISAFSPIASITQCSWGINALNHYLGPNQKDWHYFDVCNVLKTSSWPHGEILIDQGSADSYLQDELKTNLLKDAVSQNKIQLNLRFQEGYDHSYYFVSSFIEDHLRFHVKNLK